MEKPNKYQCEKCKDIGIVSDRINGFHTCWDCLNNHKLDTPKEKLL